MDKTFRLAPSDLQPIAEGHGNCIATSRITVDGQPVGHMYREESAFPEDSGWRFTAGTESDEYGRNPDNWDVVDVNLVANLDPEIVGLLDAEVGAAYVRWPMGAPLRPAAEMAAAPAAESERGASPDDSGTDAPDAAGTESAAADAPQHQALNRDWWIDLPGPFSGFMSGGALQLVSASTPPRRVWVDIRNAKDGGRPGIGAMVVKDIRLAAKPAGAQEYNEAGADPGEYRIGYWFEEHRESEKGYWTLYTYTVRDESFVQAAFLSTTPDPDWALAAWRSMRYQPGTGQEWEPAVPDDE
jgi:hypothetical protein